ncbi:MFS general substrate transporter [Aspergillus heteromorphus CBS 117.55]|uniref:MFS general substrate transporter n=1 Tax=Aspergillus heteromorphus CBS 117.55 TaxID=1448321 RepID=A0A317UXE9_9EURO|nr:MFS general substrate transporter [Aspergillus heteromorphus CBS 117.55]PWY66713.1 MFS general substrate transporter [Aspergillus heteromorphus CBS 117.55]
MASPSPSPKDQPPDYPRAIPHWRMLVDQSVLTQEIIDYPYAGSGTPSDPYVVEWIPDDPRNPMLFPNSVKWAYTIIAAFATFGVSMASSAYAGSITQVVGYFSISDEVATLGVSLFVLGFAIGPLVWAPLSELIGRQLVFFISYLGLAVFCAAATGSQNPWTLIILRFFAGSFGASPLTNAGGLIADVFPAEQRGLAMSVFAGSPFLGPTLGPIIGGFLGESAGWKWVQGFLALFSGIIWLIQALLVPETYAPVLLRHRAAKLTSRSPTGAIYTSKLDLSRGPISITSAFTTALLRPWILLFAEPIVLLLSLYMAIIYGTLYMLFDAFPIVYQSLRGWSEGIGSLPFLGVMVGMMTAVVYNMLDNTRYKRLHAKYHGFAPPESRLPPTMLGSITIPIGLFWFAWTNGPSLPWIISVIAAAPFGFGMVLVFLNIMSYLIDAYTIYAASVLAANSIIRSCFGAGFPLFTTYMYENLGIHWASSVPAFLALACVPFPFVFYKYGPAIRRRCKYAAEADDFMRGLAERTLAAGGILVLTRVEVEVQRERESVIKRLFGKVNERIYSAWNRRRRRPRLTRIAWTVKSAANTDRDTDRDRDRLAPGGVWVSGMEKGVFDLSVR